MRAGRLRPASLLLSYSTAMSPPLPFSLRQLQYAVAIADAGSFRKAAEACHVAQPSLSAQIATLEEALGVVLFERGRGGVRVSAPGEAVLVRARSLLRDAADLGEEARRVSDPLAGTLRIGVIPTVAPYLLPALAPALRGALPSLAVRWREDKTELLVRALRDGSLDAAILAEEGEIAGLSTTLLAVDRFVLVLPPEHPLAQRPGPVSAALLADSVVLLLDEGHCLRAQALPFCSRSGLREGEFRATSLPTLVAMVAAGAGVTLLPQSSLATEARRSDVALRALIDAPSRTLVLAWRPGSVVADAMRRLAEVMAPAVRAVVG